MVAAVAVVAVAAVVTTGRIMVRRGGKMWL
jgi:hypothetical protein